MELKDVREVVEAVLGDIADAEEDYQVDIHTYLTARLNNTGNPTMSDRRVFKDILFRILYGTVDTSNSADYLLIKKFKNEFPRISRLCGLFDENKEDPKDWARKVKNEKDKNGFGKSLGTVTCGD